MFTSRIDYIEIGGSPSGEDCVQVSRHSDYLPAMRAECKRFKEMLEKRFPVPSSLEGKVWFSIKSNPHDFGSYLEVVVKYDMEDEQASEFALFVESNTPETWSDEKVLTFDFDSIQQEKEAL